MGVDPIISKSSTTNNKVLTFKNYAQCITDLYTRKNTDYGDSFGISVQKYGLIAALTRISDKFNRLESLILNHTSLVKDEKLEDTLLDLASYCIMTCIELDTTDKTKE